MRFWLQCVRLGSVLWLNRNRNRSRNPNRSLSLSRRRSRIMGPRRNLNLHLNLKLHRSLREVIRATNPVPLHILMTVVLLILLKLRF